MNMFEFLKSLVATQDREILFILGLIATAMMIDFWTGFCAAKMNPTIKFESGKGINGILRKITSLMLMFFFIPVSILLPNDTGVALLYTMYIGYLIFEITSIFENAEKMGLNVALFKKFTNNFKVDESKDKKEKGE
ncbi:holin, phi29 family [Granulicatella balaenopterae]|uniref:Holin, phi29 family n=1 Tax=Granulicatella balaenopterae TaxID=137733 RepID=A0A1H9IJH0_9LACT|nr:phage holin family protein [Granulicatella balaenopterae]SEQ74743.1 holin, phi29 family [Granulicatella balaenopterae]